MNALVYVDIDQGIHKGKIKVALNEKRKKLWGFSFSINIANFEAFLSRIKLTKNLLFFKSVEVWVIEIKPDNREDHFILLSSKWRRRSKGQKMAQLCLSHFLMTRKLTRPLPSTCLLPDESSSRQHFLNGQFFLF